MKNIYCNILLINKKMNRTRTKNVILSMQLKLRSDRQILKDKDELKEIKDP